MSIEITDIADVQDGDIVTLRWKEEAGVTVTLEGPAQDSTVGDFRITRGRFVSATREVPEWEPGTVGTATVRGVEGVRVMRTSGTGGADVMWLSASMVSGVRGHEGCHVTDFLPDDAEALRRDVVKYKEAARKYQREHDKECAEVERLRAARTVPTREQIAEALWPHAPEGARAGLVSTDMVDRVANLFEQGGAS